MAVRGVFFDAAGVLYTRAESTGSYVSRLLAERGYAPEIRFVDAARHGVLRNRAQRGLLGAEDYWDRRLQMHGVADPGERRALIDLIGDHSDRVEPIPGGRELLSGLRQRGYVLGVVTDTIYPVERKRRWLEAVGVDEFIDVLACSTELGLHKPQSAIYLHAVREAGLVPAESAFVGHAADELEGARLAGLVTVAVHCDPGSVADYTGHSLLDLLSLPIFGGSERHRPGT